MALHDEADNSWRYARQRPRGPWRNGAARTADIVVCIVALLFTLPLLVAVAVAVKLCDGGPILFAHPRIGRGGREFLCLKFRTMAVDSENRLRSHLAASASARWEWQQLHKLRVDPRITRIGRFLRASSLDELPQLINVLRGEMTLVGPRPITRAEAGRYGRYLSEYVSVRPGLTGLWQAFGRSQVSYRRRVAMDIYYVRRRSFLLDMMIMGATVPAVLLRRGAG